MTDSEIVKALECCGILGVECDKNCPRYNNGMYESACQRDLIISVLSLITRQQAEIENYIKVAERQQSLSLERDFEIKRLRAEIEKLKQPLNVRFEKFESEYDSKIKSEARREFAERVKEHTCDIVLYGEIVTVSSINSLLKEMEREP